jgi:hypothetical protein
MTVPDVSGLRSDVIYAVDGSPYMRRFYLMHTQELSVRYHEIVQSDDARVMHDHPWDFVSVLLAGSYLEVTPAGERCYAAGDVVVRRAEDAHRLEVLDGPVWTLVSTTKPLRRWGFYTPEGWVHWRDYAAGPVESVGWSSRW